MSPTSQHAARAMLLMAMCAAALVESASAVGVGADKPMAEVVRLPESGIAPQAATDDGGHVHLIYFKGDPAAGDIFYIRSDDGGKNFTPPLRVNSQLSSAIALGIVRVPQLAVGKDGRVHVAWMGSKSAEPKAADQAAPMLYARLNDAGDAFEPQRNLITRRSGLDGGGSVAADAEGNVYVAWHAPKDKRGEADRWVWLSRSEDEGKTFSTETAANPEPTGACGCCGMKVAAGAGGRVYVLYRSATDGVNRNVYLLASSDHGKTFRTAVDDPWRIGACVMSTAAFAGYSTAIVGAWETKGRIRFAVVPFAGQHRVSGDVPGESDLQKHPAVAVNAAGRFVIAWAEGTGWNKGGTVAWQVYDKDGSAIAGQAGRARGLPAWSMPAVFARHDGTFAICY